jgi:hypothetical protein
MLHRYALDGALEQQQEDAIANKKKQHDLGK